MRCTVEDFFTHPDASALLAEYGAESRIAGMPVPTPHRPTYEAIEQSGRMALLVAVDGDHLLGFVTVLTTLNPHYSAVVSVLESFFVVSAHRKSGAGLRLLQAAEGVARENGAVGLLVSAPSESRLATVLDARDEYRETNRVFFKALS